MTLPKHRKKLIEVALPLEAINKASAREKSIRHGHPSTLHLWWARRPLAAARAVIFSQMVDDPSEYVDVLLRDSEVSRAAKRELKKRLAEHEAKKALGGAEKVSEPEPTLEAVAADLERQRLFKIIEDLVLWENTTNEAVLERARAEIWQSWRRACAENVDHPRARELFDRHKLPAFHDPFAGGGALPLEAQRLGLEAHASDLNPVAVLINKAMIEIPPKFAGRPPVNPESRSEWRGERKEDALQADDRLAKSLGGGAGVVSAGSDAPQGGDLRNAFPDHAGDRVDSGEHRGGLDARVDSGEDAIPGDRARLAGGGGDFAHSLRADRLVSDPGNSNSEAASGRDKPHADDSPSQVPKPITLTPHSSSLTPHFPSLTPHSSSLFPREWKGAQGLAEDVRYYGHWMRDEAEKRIGHLYPKVQVIRNPDGSYRHPTPAELSSPSSPLTSLTVIAWLWARTVKSTNPAFRDVDVPLASTFMLSTKPGKEAYVEVVKDEHGDKRENASGSHSSLLSTHPSPYRFTVKMGKPTDEDAAKAGTKLGRGANFQCVMSGTPIAGDYIKAEGKAGRMGARLMAIVAEGDRGRVYLGPTPEHEAAAHKAKPLWKPEGDVPARLTGGTCVPYGLSTWGDLFTSRQLVALTTFSDLVQEARERVQRDALQAGLSIDPKPLRDGGTGATAYAEAVGVYLAFAVDKAAEGSTSLCVWSSLPSKLHIVSTFGRQALPMTWDYAESNVFADSSGNILRMCGLAASVVERQCSGPVVAGGSSQVDAAQILLVSPRVVSTDPPYYDNIGYADLSDFFYVWLRRSLRPTYPDLFATLAVPKAEELVATPYRHGSKEKAEIFFLDGMTQAMHCLADQAHPAFPVSIYYAFKQAESDTVEGTASTGWDTFLEAVIRARFGISGTWPMRTERAGGFRNKEQNALASSIVLVCRPRAAAAPTATRREFIAALKAELPLALAHLQRGNIAPVDLAQAAIGPGMAVYTRFARVLDAEGNPLSVRDALALINQTLDEALAEQEGDFDADTRWALAWFEQSGFAEGEYGVAEMLSKAKNTSVGGLVEAGILVSKGGKVRLLKPGELSADWDPLGKRRGERSEKRDQSDLTPHSSPLTPQHTVWEMVHHLIRVLEAGGDQAAAGLAAGLGSKAEIARELAYRLYTLCERKKRAPEALSYNGLVQSWPEIARLAREASGEHKQEELF
jgi:putative DNA methylase